MKRFDLITPEGTRDLLFDDCLIRKSVETKIHKIFESRGYSEVVTPGLEFYDVFNLNSRYFPQENLYKLTDNKGRLLVVRPDSTMPIARLVSTRLKDAELPLRLFYNQSVYSPNKSLAGKSNEVVQTGIELIGTYSRKADLDVLSTAVEVLSSCDNEKFRLEIGDIGFFRELVNQLPSDDEVKEKIRRLIEVKNYPALNDLLDSIGENKVTNALKQLPRLFGGEEVFDKASSLFCDEKIEEILSNLEFIYTSLEKLGYNGKITVDLGIVNRTDYYTGVVMKGYIQGYGEEVLSGGRYDKLISEFGYDVPATGFAVNVDAISEMLKNSGVRLERNKTDIIIFSDEKNAMDALIYAQKMRNGGYTVEYSPFDTIEETKHYAQTNGNIKIIVYRGEDDE